MVMHLACVNMKMSMNEALAAATINAAYALGKSDTHGSIEIGKQGDLVIINSPRYVLLLLFVMWFNIRDLDFHPVTESGEVNVFLVLQKLLSSVKGDTDNILYPLSFTLIIPVKGKA